MAHCYFDTSALVKYYIVETGTRWVRASIEERDGDQWVNTISTSALTWAETVSALSRHRRSKLISDSLCTRLIARFLRDGRSRYTRLPTDDATINQAIEIIQRHPLRAYDAVQLDRVLRDNRLSPVTFVSADETLCGAARAEGMSAENPNDYP
jgi:predicted nucleic acid-binding protein